MSENGKIYTADKNFTLRPAVTALTNSTSVLFLWNPASGLEINQCVFLNQFYFCFPHALMNRLV